MGEVAVALSGAALELAEALRAHRAALAELDARRRALAEAARRHTRKRSPRAERAVRDAQATVDAANQRVVEIGREGGAPQRQGGRRGDAAGARVRRERGRRRAGVASGRDAIVAPSVPR